MRVLFIGLILFQVSNLFPQSENHKWKPLIITESQKIWYDESQTDTIKSSMFDVWVLELHQPLLSVDGIKSKVMRSKTLYQVNAEDKCYNLKAVVYYNASNVEVARYNYDLTLLNENKRYTFPVYDDSYIDKILKVIFVTVGEK